MEPNTKVIQMLELADKNLKQLFITKLNDINKVMILMNKGMGNLSREVENMKRNQVEIPELKIAISEIKTSLVCLTSERRWKGK